MIVGLLTLRMVFRESHSLKDKRHFLRSLKDRIKNEFNASVAEVGEQDHLQLAEIACAMVGTERRGIESTLGEIRKKARYFSGGEVIGEEVEYF